MIVRVSAMLGLLAAVASCGPADPGAAPRKPTAADYFREDAPSSRRAREERAEILRDEDGDGVVTTGYAQIGISSDGPTGGGGFLMRRGNVTLGLGL